MRHDPARVRCLWNACGAHILRRSEERNSSRLVFIDFGKERIEAGR
jgi:hypothetical protein